MTILIVSLIAKDNWCRKVKDEDQRGYCESVYEGKKSCWKIKSNDSKARCEAVAYGKNSCWKIKDKSKRTMCELESE